MRIGIITHWWSLDNYGQQLQCYALQMLLRGWGHDAFLIRYKPKAETPSLWQRVALHLRHPGLILLHLPIDSVRKREARQERELREINKRDNPKRQFEEFRERYLRMSSRFYESYEELKSYPPDADMYIAGSDQIWRSPLTNSSKPGWFLHFGDQRVRRISYAASMGDGVNERERHLLRGLLSVFDSISVREEYARQESLGAGYDAQVCIDPTMLLQADAYRTMAKPVDVKQKYAFVYVLNVRSAEEFGWPQIKQYIDEKGLAVRSVTGSGYYQGRELIENNKNLLLTIQEWLGCMEGASCVITTSFHGTVFAILMHRPFLVIGLQGKFSGANTRIEQLLLKLDIAERIFNPNKSVREQMEAIIDWEMVDQRIAEMQKSSIEFLKGNLYKKEWK